MINNGGDADDLLFWLGRHGLVPLKGNGPATFVRATVKNTYDFENKYFQALAGELAQYGMRRVRNLVATTSEDITNAAWTKNAGTAGASSVTIGGMATKRFTLTGGSALHYVTQPITGAVDKWVSAAIDVTGIANHFAAIELGGASAQFTWTSPTTISVSGTGGATAAYKIVGAYQAIIYGRHPTAASATVTIYAGAYAPYTGDGQYYDITRLMSEDITGQTNTNPSEYVSVGVESSPYHGHGVDGVKYFPYLNGNTVASNVVTEAVGAAIATDYARHIEAAAATNILLYSNDYTNAVWVKTDTTVTSTNNPDPFGTNTAALLTEGTLNTAGIAQVSTITAAANVPITCHLKRGNHDWMRFYASSGAATISVWFNMATGTFGSSSVAGGASLLSTRVTSLINSWYKADIVVNFGGALTAISSGELSATADGSLGRVNNGTRYQFGSQLENNKSSASSYIATTTASVMRNGDQLTYPATNISNVATTIVAEVANFGGTGANTALVGINDGAATANKIDLYLNVNNNVGVAINSSGVLQANVLDTGAAIGTSLIKVACVAKTNDVRLYKSGASVGTPDTSATMPVSFTSAIGIGDRPNNALPFNGGIGEVKTFRRAKLDVVARALTK